MDIKGAGLGWMTKAGRRATISTDIDRSTFRSILHASMSVGVTTVNGRIVVTRSRVPPGLRGVLNLDKVMLEVNQGLIWVRREAG
jgi:hypothetical protein